MNQVSASSFQTPPVLIYRPGGMDGSVGRGRDRTIDRVRAFYHCANAHVTDGFGLKEPSANEKPIMERRSEKTENSFPDYLPSYHNRFEWRFNRL
ncbi:hypothetical protein Y032_0010g951 [Ancylostoma ceylanicum]|nr:hypothetical protein Y032_0010g951 [Ancylostoma ceylanicum]